MGDQVLFIGPFPAPVTGQTVMTEFIYRELLTSGVAVTSVDVVRGNTKSKAANTAIRTVRVLGAVSKVLLAPRTICYVSLDANRGMLVSAILLLAARLRGHHAVLHHHSYSHIADPSKVFALLCSLAPIPTTHLVICQTMLKRLQDTYPQVENGLTLSNICALEEQPRSERSRSNDPLTLGFLSNLSFEKGVKEAIDTVRRLNEVGRESRLILAGPADDGARTYVLNAASEDSRIEWVGPVYGEDKSAFFESIDVFLFPTRYKNETQGIVNLEALASGTPTVAFNRCCVGEDLDGLEGWLVPQDGDFAGAACSLLADIDDERLTELGDQAQEQFRHLRVKSAEELKDLVVLLSAIPDRFERLADYDEASSDER